MTAPAQDAPGVTRPWGVQRHPSLLKSSPLLQSQAAFPQTLPGSTLPTQENASEPLVVHEGNALHRSRHVPQTRPAFITLLHVAPGAVEVSKTLPSCGAEPSKAVGHWQCCYVACETLEYFPRFVSRRVTRHSAREQPLASPAAGHTHLCWKLQNNCNTHVLLQKSPPWEQATGLVSLLPL